MERRLTQRGRERRRQLMEVASRLFAEHGYHPTSVAEIVDAAAVGKGVFYWYFDSKEEVFLEILRTAQLDLRRRQLRAIEGVDDPVLRIEAGIRAGVLWMLEHPDMRRLFEFARTDDTFARAIKAGQAQLVADATAQLRQAVAGGHIPERDPEALAHAVLGITNQLTMVYAETSARDPEEIADLVVSICRSGFAGA
jgi:AcrR family transcriptional regulator